MQVSVSIALAPLLNSWHSSIIASLRIAYRVERLRTKPGGRDAIHDVPEISLDGVLDESEIDQMKVLEHLVSNYMIHVACYTLEIGQIKEPLVAVMNAMCHV